MNGENVKQSLKKNLKQGANSAVKDVTRISVRQIKRKLDDVQESSASPKLQKKKEKKCTYNQENTNRFRTRDNF